MKKPKFLTLFLFCFFCFTMSLQAQNETKTSDSIKKLIEKKRNYNKKNGFGYTIQVYYGNERTAKSTHAKFGILYPRVSRKLVYNNPEWKVQVGNYKTKLEADRANLIFSKEFTGTIVIPMGK
ncbi:SPOR domain-containing protein [Polaribacter sp.]|uniref:SPOR domain-containing protein n=1 Tax=Polaribacter sp. TaxID=1920175 RepID=UPI003F6D1E13